MLWIPRRAVVGIRSVAVEIVAAVLPLLVKLVVLAVVFAIVQGIVIVGGRRVEEGLVAEVAGSSAWVKLPRAECYPCVGVDGERRIVAQIWRQDGAEAPDLFALFSSLMQHGQNRHAP